MIPLPILRRLSTERVLVPCLLLLSAALIISQKIDPPIFAWVRVSVVDALAPVLGMVARPLSTLEDYGAHAIGLFSLYKENSVLSAENRKLLHWEHTARALAAENEQLRRMLKVVPEPAVSYVTARIIVISDGASMRSALIDAGSENGVGHGQAVVTGDGLFGRVYDVGRRTARVLSINDLNSRVPVIIERTRQRAILAGDDSERPQLRYLDPAGLLKLGDRIVTSGDGGVFPSGIPVGVVAESDRSGLRVRPFVESSAVDFVSIADFGLSNTLPAVRSGFSRTENFRTNCRRSAE